MANTEKMLVTLEDYNNFLKNSNKQYKVNLFELPMKKISASTDYNLMFNDLYKFMNNKELGPAIFGFKNFETCQGDVVEIEINHLTL